jgi:hypothetical protein
MTRLSSQSSTRLAIAEETHEAILRTSLLTRRRSATRFAIFVRAAYFVALPSCSEETRVRDARGETGPLAQSRARATYLSDVSVALLLSAFESAAALLSPIWLVLRLLREEKGQRCSWRERAASTERGEHDLLEQR